MQLDVILFKVLKVILVICKILKPGSDWRMMGERLGIPAETINQWKRWKVDQPMYYVLQTWSQSTGATVRILHRHLVSPQMKCTLLAKRISDFYKVD